LLATHPSLDLNSATPQFQKRLTREVGIDAGLDLGGRLILLGLLLTDVKTNKQHFGRFMPQLRRRQHDLRIIAKFLKDPQSNTGVCMLLLYRHDRSTLLSFLSEDFPSELW
jgi:xylose isomerase